MYVAVTRMDEGIIQYFVDSKGSGLEGRQGEILCAGFIYFTYIILM